MSRPTAWTVADFDLCWEAWQAGTNGAAPVDRQEFLDWYHNNAYRYDNLKNLVSGAWGAGWNCAQRRSPKFEGWWTNKGFEP